MTSYTVGQAARLTGKSKPTITRAIKAGTLSAIRNDDRSYSIDAAELSRVFVLSAGSDVTRSSNTNRHMTRSETHDEPIVLQRENELLREMLVERDAVIGDLRVRLDEERTDRRQALDRLAAAQERIAALLTDQRQPAPNPPPVPAKRRWWLWRS
jgi:excisionase family DNA binding protein